jgi:hypothetical protein
MRNRGAEWGHAAFGQERGSVTSLIFVACAVGAIAGAGAVFSLVGQPESETSGGVSQRALGPGVARAAAYSSPRPVAPAPSQGQSPSTASASQEEPGSHLAVIDESESEGERSGSSRIEAKVTAPERPAATTREPIAKASPAPATGSQSGTDIPPAEKKATKRPAYSSRYAWRGGYRDGGRWGGFLEERGWRSRQYW